MKHKATHVLISAVCINMIMGINYIWSIISRQLVAQQGWTNTQATMPYILSLFMVSVSMILGGRICDRGHPKECAGIGALLFGGGLILCGFTDNPALITIGYGLILGTGNGLCTVSTTATAMKWFPQERRGMISGICMAGFACSSIYISLLANFLLENYGISGTFLYAGFASLILLLIFACFLAPADTGIDNNIINVNDNIINREMDWRAMISTAEFYKLWVIFIFGMGGGLMIMGSIATIIYLQGGIANAAPFVILIAVFNALGRFTIGILSDKIGVRNSFFLMLALQMLNMLLFRFYSSMPALIAGTAVAGYAFGGIVAMNAPSASKFSVKNLAQNAAVIIVKTLEKYQK